MLPQQHRLPSFAIRDVMRRGRRIVGNDITLIYLKSEYNKIDTGSDVDEKGGECRFSFIISTKVDKRAVVRNRMRRVLSESVFHLLSILHPTIDCVFFGSKGLVGIPQVEVQTRMIDMLRKAHLLKNESGIMNTE